jgi:hypothetical protein
LDPGVHHFEIQSTYVLPEFQFNVFDAGVWNGTTYQIYVASNSSVSGFRLDLTQRTLSFNVTGEYSSLGFCKVTIPDIIIETLWKGRFTVTLDEQPINFTIWTDDGKTYLYFTYPHSEHTITIIRSPSIIGDINGDGKVDIQDLILFIKAFGSYPTHPRWNPDADFDSDSKIDIKDLIQLLKNFGKT